jgi:putative transcriptional regulator
MKASLVNHLPQILEQKAISIRELARRTGVTYTTIRAVVQSERRSIQLEVLEAICSVLDVTPGDIYRLELPPKDSHIEERHPEKTDRKKGVGSEQLRKPGWRYSKPARQQIETESGKEWRSW